MNGDFVVGGWAEIVSWSTRTVNAVVDWAVEVSEDIVKLFILTLTILFLATVAIHLFPLAIIWLAGAPFWVVVALFFGH